MAVSKIKMSNARRALIQAGMSRTMARGALRLLDLNEPLKPQIEALAEEDPELFGLDADGNPLDAADDPDDDERPMTPAEAKRSRLQGRHRLAPSRPDDGTPAARNAAALGANRERSERKSTAPATAQAAAARLRAGVGRAAD
ncbi:hypothetical protein AB0918_24580 [Streptomyces sp. NPDC006864]|uniref:hypothetical protein n=1 Tax=Streptomyces sp. NPDC006864 TaxID=3154780 RepID=UPI00345690BC